MTLFPAQATIAGVVLFLFTGVIRASEFAPAETIPIFSPGEDVTVTRVAFASCANQNQDMRLFGAIGELSPDVFLFIGDNVYAETEKDDPELASLKEAYRDLAQAEPFTRLVANVPTMVTWDDHDFGLNDAGGDWPHKGRSEALFNHVWNVDDERADREGVYYSRTMGPKGQRVQIIVLDTRYFRTGLKKSRKRLDHGRYDPDKSRDATLLGAAQWEWLGDQLRQPADVRIIASSIQVIADGHNWEAWLLFPRERERLYRLIQRTRANGVVFLSGDRHSAALYETDLGEVRVPEITASSVNLPLSGWVENIVTEPGPNRYGVPYYDANFGLVEIDWDTGEIIMQVRDYRNRTVRAASVKLEDMTFR